MKYFIAIVLHFFCATAWADVQTIFSSQRMRVQGRLTTQAISIPGDRTRIKLKLDMADADSTDTTKTFTFGFEVSVDSIVWTPYGSAETGGSTHPVRLSTLGDPELGLPFFEARTPPRGHSIRAFVTTNKDTNLGFRIEASDVPQGIRSPSEHNSVAYDGGDDNTANAVRTLTTPPFTISSGSDRAFVLAIFNGQAGITVSSAVCAGITATSAGARTLNVNRSVHLFYGVAPNTGSQTASVTFSDSWGTSLMIGANVFTGVDQTTPVSDLTTDTEVDTDITVTVPNAGADDMIVDGASIGGGGTQTAGANQTERLNNLGTGACSTQDGADGGVMSWTGEFNQSVVLAAIRVVASAGGATTAPVKRRSMMWIRK